MAGLDPAIHPAFKVGIIWMAASRAAMTMSLIPLKLILLQ